MSTHSLLNPQIVLLGQVSNLADENYLWLHVKSTDTDIAFNLDSKCVAASTWLPSISLLVTQDVR